MACPPPLIHAWQKIEESQNIFSEWTVTNATNISAGFGTTLSPFAWSIPLAFKVVANIVSNYVTKKTGISFVSWVAFIDTSLIQLGEYVNQLDNIATLSLKYDHKILIDTDVDMQQITKDEDLLKDIKSKTILWNSLMEQTSKLSDVINAVLEAQKEASQNNVANNEVAGDFKKMLGAVTDKVNDAMKDNIKGGQEQLVKWAFSSVSDLKDKTKDLSNQTKKLSSSISALEHLLDLEIAQIQAYTGKIPPKEVEILGKRIAATVIVPQLKEELTKIKQNVTGYQAILEKLETEYKDKAISENVYQILVLEYRTRLNTNTVQLNKLNIQVRTWKTIGISLLEDGVIWMREQLEVIKARKLVGEIIVDELKQKSKVLNLEINRLEEAKNIILSM